MSSTVGTLQEMLSNQGVEVPRRDLNRKTPAERSLAEKWVVAKTQEAYGGPQPPSMPPWLRSYIK